MKRLKSIFQYVHCIAPDITKKEKRAYVQYGLKCALVRKWPSMLKLG